MDQNGTPEECIMALRGHLSEGAYAFGYIEQIARQTGNYDDRIQAQKYKQRYIDLDKEFCDTLVNINQFSEAQFLDKIKSIEDRIALEPVSQIP